MPPVWLAELQEAVKADRPNTLALVLGSSFVAAIIAAASAIGSAYLTINANDRLEVKKAQIAVRQEQLKESVTVYNQLDARLGELLEEIKGVNALVQIAGGRRDASRNIAAQFAHLGVTEGTVLALKTDPHVTPDLWRPIDGALKHLTIAISNANSDPTRFSSEAATIERDLSTAIDEVRHARATAQSNSFN